MSPRGRLRGGMPRVYRDHRTGIGAAYRRVYEAISREHGPFEPGGLRALQASQAASLWLSFVAATETLTEARERRASDRGRRPSPRLIDRLEHRQQVASRAFAEALDALKGKTSTAEQERRDFEAFVARYRKPQDGPQETNRER
jgi:hypothetical protein